MLAVALALVVAGDVRDPFAMWFDQFKFSSCRVAPLSTMTKAERRAELRRVVLHMKTGEVRVLGLGEVIPDVGTIVAIARREVVVAYLDASGSPRRITLRC